MEKVTESMKAMLDRPLPEEAVKKHPTKSFLSTINSIYVTERLNEVFGVGGWTIHTEFADKADTKNGGVMVVVKTTLEVPAYDIHYESYGGNDNADLGDAYKGAVTDALTKIGSWMGIGAAVWKDKSENDATKNPARPVTKVIVPVDKVIEEVYRLKKVADIEDLYRKHSANYGGEEKDKLISACRAAKADIENPKVKKP